MIEQQQNSAMQLEGHIAIASSSKSGVKWPQFLAGGLAAGSAVCSGAVVGWSLLQNDATSAYRAGDEDAVLIVALMTLGAVVGALPAGFLADGLGRKLVLLLVAVLFWLGGILLSAAPHVAWAVSTSHLISGLAAGCASVVVPLYNEEIAELEIRGSIGALYELCTSLGVLLACLLDAFFPHLSPSILHCVLAALFFASFLWMPESPVYLVASGRVSQAEAAIEWLRTSRGHRNYDVKAEVTDICKFIDNTKFKRFNRYYIAKPKSKICCGQRKGSNILIVLFLMCFRPLTGIYALISFRDTISEHSGTLLAPNMHTIILSILFVVCNILASSLVDRAGRRVLMISSVAGITVCHVLFAQYFYLHELGYDSSSWSWVPLSVFLACISLYCLGVGPLPWLMMAEILPAETKRWSLGVAAVVNWLLVFLVTKGFYLFAKLIGLTETFALLFILNVLGVIFAIFFLPETMRRSREEIQ